MLVRALVFSTTSKGLFHGIGQLVQLLIAALGTRLLGPATAARAHVFIRALGILLGVGLGKGCPLLAQILVLLLDIGYLLIKGLFALLGRLSVPRLIGFKLGFEPLLLTRIALALVLAHLMKKIWPSYSDTSELDLSKLSRDEAVVQAYANDPLVLKKISAGLFSSILSASDWAIENAAKLKIPTLLYHGTADQVISIEGSEQFAKNSNENLTFERLEGVYHEPHNDYGKEEVVQKIIEWMSTHC